MAEIVNLRRVRKAKARAEDAAKAGASRAKHGVAKVERDFAEARDVKAARELDAKRLMRDKSTE